MRAMIARLYLLQVIITCHSIEETNNIVWHGHQIIRAKHKVRIADRLLEDDCSIDASVVVGS